MEIKNGKQIYEVGDLVGKNGIYRLFICVQKESGRQCLLQIATSVENNGRLDRMAYLLHNLDKRAGELEKKFRDINPGKELNYNLGFPELVDSFIHTAQAGCRINILAFRCVDDVSSVVPLINITAKDRLCVDLRTSAWIMGKTLKLLSFTQSESIAVNVVNSNNILVVPDNHYVLLFNLTAAEILAEGTPVPMEVRIQEISQAAKAIITVLGGDWKTNFIPNDGDEPFQLYVDCMLERKKDEGNEGVKKYCQEAFALYANFLFRLANGNESDALRAHRDFYEIVDRLWKREYYPFTTKTL